MKYSVKDILSKNMKYSFKGGVVNKVKTTVLGFATEEIVTHINTIDIKVGGVVIGTLKITAEKHSRIMRTDVY